jgi:hypothetical protein
VDLANIINAGNVALPRRSTSLRTSTHRRREGAQRFDDGVHRAAGVSQGGSDEVGGAVKIAANRHEEGNDLGVPDDEEGGGIVDVAYSHVFVF